MNDASKESIRNMEEVSNAKLVGCYHCLEIYPSYEIVETTDAGQTALCARCGIDSVLADTSAFSLDIETLKALNDQWF